MRTMEPDPLAQPRARLLLVDDDDISIGILAEILRNLGISAVLADSGAAALQALSQGERFDAVFMDCEMPGASGFDTARAIRRMPAHAALPIYAMTGNVSGEDVQRALDAGMTGHIAKPIRLKTLLPVLAIWLDAHAAPLSTTIPRPPGAS